MAYIVMAYIVMAYIVMAYIVMAYIVMAYIVMAYIVMAYIVMDYIVMAYIVMAYIVMAYRASRLKWQKRGHIWGWGQFKNHAPLEGQNGWNRGGSSGCAVPYLAWQTSGPCMCPWPVVGPNLWG
jgi:hypothetical protein